MESVSIRDLFQNTARYAGKTICVGGWVRSVRASKAFGFIFHPVAGGVSR